MINHFNNKYKFLSNFSPSRVRGSNPGVGLWYATVEHAYQAQKTLIYSERIHIASLHTPGQAKRAGRKVILRDNWDRLKVPIMRMLIQQKFLDSKLAVKLLSTGDQGLCEGNYWHDQFWGNCTCPKHKDILGKNTLGKILMAVRQELRDNNENGGEIDELL